MRRFFNLSHVFGTLTVFFFMWLLGFVGVQFDFLNVFEDVLSQYDLTDVYYTKFRNQNEVPFEEDVVLVNIGNLPRRGIAAQIDIINKHNPKVIGIDAFFNYPKEDNPQGDSLLAQSVANVENFVMVSKLDGYSEKNSQWDTLILSYDLISQHASSGFANTISDEDKGDFVTWRNTPVSEKLVSGDNEISFAAKIMSFFNKEAADEFINRGRDVETIYFKGNLDKYVKLDIEDIFSENFAPEMIEGKIVLMGYLGSGGYTDYFFDEDKFFTPLNEKSVGRGVPDMYGVVVHANILSMMLDKTYINEMHSGFSIAFAVILCYLNVALFTIILRSPMYGPWYNAMSKLIQLVEAIALFTIDFFSFAIFNYSADLTLATFAVLLSGDLTEIYVDIVLTSIRKVMKR